MKRPVAELGRGDVDGQLLAGLRQDGVQTWQVALAVRITVVARDHEVEEHAVQVDRVRHHRVVHQGQAHALALVELDALLHVRELHAVERPHVAFHVGRQVDLDLTLGWPHVRVRAQAAKLRVGQRAMRDALQSHAGLVQAVDRVHRGVRDARPHRVVVLGHVHAGMFHRHAATLAGALASHAHADHAPGHRASARSRLLVHVLGGLLLGVGQRVALPRHAGFGRASHRGVHPRHAAHPGHAHVLHRQQRTWAQGRGLGRLAEAGRQRRQPLVRAVDGRRDEAVGAVLRLHDHVVGLGGTDLELVGLDGAHVEAVHVHDRHRQARDAHVEDRHGRGVDDPQAHPLARREQARPVVLRAVPVDEVGVLRAGDVGDVSRRHPHVAPHQPVLDRGAEAVFLRVGREVGHRALLEVERVAHLLEFGEEAVRVLERPVREHHDVLAVIGRGLRARRVDHDRAVVAELLLEGAVRVVPVGASLLQREAVLEGRARRDAGEAHPRHAVHVEGHEQAVPVDRRPLVQRVVHAQRDVLPLPHADERRGQDVVDRHAHAAPPVDAHGIAGDAEVVGGPGGRGEARVPVAGVPRPGGQEGGGDEAAPGGAQEGASGLHDVLVRNRSSGG